MNKNYRDLIRDLVIWDQKPAGRWPFADAASVQLARDWLRSVLHNPVALRDHVAELVALYKTSFLPPDQRKTEFRHLGLLPERLAAAVLETGPEALTDTNLARLLLSPFALDDLHSRAEDARSPDEAESDDDLVFAEPLLKATVVRGQGAGPSAGELDLDAVTRYGLAEALYGDATLAFTLTLVTKPAGPDALTFELLVAPAPRRQVAVAITFPAGEVRQFVLAVQEQLDPEADPPADFRSLPCEPIAATTYVRHGGVERVGECWQLALRQRLNPRPRSSTRYSSSRLVERGGIRARSAGAQMTLSWH